MKPIVILYHSGCEDGFGGAWAAWKKFGARADYIPIKHQTPPPPGLKGKIIYIIDIFYPIPVLKFLIRANKKVVAIDHHKGVEAATKTAPEYVFDLDHSGAVLAWRYFHPKKSVPYLLKIVEEQDLWKFKLPNTKELSSYLKTVPHDFHAWSELAKQWENGTTRKEHARAGATALRYQNLLIKEIIQEAKKGIFEDKRVWIVNSPILTSQIGNMLAKQGPFIALIWRHFGNTIRVSLRSTKGIDVAKLAERFGGGGHPQAAGFRIPADQPMPWKYQTKK